MPEKHIVDLEEEYDPALKYVDGSDQEYLRFEPDEIELHNKNFAECIELDQIRSLSEAFPEVIS
jgi:hypothetical protein